jgi:hypothetical protein
MKKIFYTYFALTILLYNGISVALLNETNIDPNGRSILETNERGSE